MTRRDLATGSDVAPEPLLEHRPIVYTAHSKATFYCRDFICAAVLQQNCVPLNPFRMFGYFLSDLVDRDLVRRANNNVIATVDEVWTFGPVADGVLLEISLAHRLGIPVRHLTATTQVSTIVELRADELVFESELVDAVDGDVAVLREVVDGSRTLDALPLERWQSRPSGDRPTELLTSRLSTSIDDEEGSK